MLSTTKIPANSWDARARRYIWGIFAVIGILYVTIWVLLRNVVPIFVQAPTTSAQVVALDRLYSWSSYPTVERAVNDALVATNANGYPGCMTYATLVTQRDSTYRLSNIFVQRCPDCIAKVNILQVDYHPDGGQDTTRYDQVSFELALGLWPWEQSGNQTLAAQGGN